MNFVTACCLQGTSCCIRVDISAPKNRKEKKPQKLHPRSTIQICYWKIQGMFHSFYIKQFRKKCEYFNNGGKKDLLYWWKRHIMCKRRIHNCTHIWRNLLSYESTGGILCSHQKLNLKGITERKMLLTQC